MDNALTIQLFFFASAIAVALEAYKERERKIARIVLWGIVAIFGFFGFAWPSISEGWPRATAALAELSTSSVAWFVVAVAIYFIARPYWKQGDAKIPLDTNVVSWQPLASHIQTNASRIKEIEEKLTTLAGKIEKEPRKGDLLALSMEASEMDSRVRASVGGDLEKLAKAIREMKIDIESQKWANLAIYHRERMLDLADKIDTLGNEVGLRSEGPKNFNEADFEQWESKFSEWRMMLGQWCRYASFYVGRDPQSEIESLDENGLNENWGVRSDQFPDGGIVKYKTFRIYLRNWSHARDVVHEKVRAQAFEGQQTNTREHYGIG